MTTIKNFTPLYGDDRIAVGDRVRVTYCGGATGTVTKAPARQDSPNALFSVAMDSGSRLMPYLREILR